ncbi:MAG: DUF6262 family protein [Acidimicrobiales bacterium]
MTSPSRAEAMVATRRADSQAKRARVAEAIDHMLGERAPITFAAVARRARVSPWLVYAPGVREAVDAARRRPAGAGPPFEPGPRPAGLTTDLALAREEIARLRAERDGQRRQLQLALGARIDDAAKADLRRRVEELNGRNRDLAAEAAQLRAENDKLQARITEVEDDLSAARTSLRRMIRVENLPSPSPPAKAATALRPGAT